MSLPGLGRLPRATYFLPFVAVALVAAAGGRAEETETSARRARGLMTIEGRVVQVEEGGAEGELPLVSLRLTAGDEARQVVLAPREILTEVGFEVEVGDRVRARVFSSGEAGPVYSQKIMNLTRKRILRLRTLRQEPLWDVAGRWQGRREQVDRRRKAGSRRKPTVRRPNRRRRPPTRVPPRRPDPVR